MASDVKKARSAVQETSNTANIILKDVVTATKVISMQELIVVMTQAVHQFAIR